MEEALKEAVLSLPEDVPVGAVVVKDGKIIGRGRNVREKDHSPSGHAEVRAIEAAAKSTGDWRLSGCDLYVTLEPCPMCAGLIRSARIRCVYFGAYDPEYGAAGSVYNLLDPFVKIRPYVLGTESGALLGRFFSEMREKSEKRGAL